MYSNENANTWKPEMKTKMKKMISQKVGKTLIKQASVLPNGTKSQTPLDESVLSQWLRNERIAVDFRDKKL